MQPSVAEELGLTPGFSSEELMTVDGSELKVLGSVKVKVRMCEKELSHEFIRVECSTPLIIGMDLISNVGLAIDFASREYWTKEGHRFLFVFS